LCSKSRNGRFLRPAALVGEDRLKAVPVVIGEAQLRAGVRAFAAHDHARPVRPAAQIELVGDLDDVPVRPRRSVLVDRANPVLIGDLQDRGADGLGQVIADRVADPSVAAPVQQLVAGSRGVDAQQDLDVLDVLGRDLLQRGLGDRDLVDGGVGAGVAGPQHPGQRLAGLIAIGQQRGESQSRP
jgi:hypothetical protein